MMVMDYEGVDDKPLRDCPDEDVRLIVAFHANRGSMKLFDDEWFLSTTLLEMRERERNALEDAGLALLSLAWSRPRERRAPGMLARSGGRAVTRPVAPHA
jgi:hypothetical protein